MILDRVNEENMDSLIITLNITETFCNKQSYSKHLHQIESVDDEASTCKAWQQEQNNNNYNNNNNKPKFQRM